MASDTQLLLDALARTNEILHLVLEGQYKIVEALEKLQSTTIIPSDSQPPLKLQMPFKDWAPPLQPSCVPATGMCTCVGRCLCK